MKTVWQWRFLDFFSHNWKVIDRLMTEEEAKEFAGSKIEKHAGPFEVNE